MSDSTSMTSLLARVVLSQGSVPTWLHEGASIYFANCRSTGSEIGHGPVPRERLRGLQSRMRVGSCPPLAQVISPDRETFTPQEQSVCWAIVFWLAHSEAGRPAPEHEAALERLLSEPGTSDDNPCIATQLGLSLADLERRLHAWLKELDPEDPREASALAVGQKRQWPTSRTPRTLRVIGTAGEATPRTPDLKPRNRLDEGSPRARRSTPGHPHRN